MCRVSEPDMEVHMTGRQAILLVVSFVILIYTARAVVLANSGRHMQEPSVQSVVPTQSNQQTPSQTGITQVPKQAVEMPLLIIPLIIEYAYSPAYYLQWIADDPNYSIIEAVLIQSSPPLYQIVLTEKATKQRVFYASSEENVKALIGAGKIAQQTAIDVKVIQEVGEPAVHVFSFRDKRGQAIQWRFVHAAEASERGGGLIPGRRQELSFDYRRRGTAAGEGSAVQIGTNVNYAKPWPQISSPPYFVAYRGTHAVESEVGAFIDGNEQWQIKTTPANLNEGAQWTQVNAFNVERQMKVTARKGDEVTISEVDGGQLSPATRTTIIAKETALGLAVRSVTFTNSVHTMQVTFTPELNLSATSSSASSFDVAFQVDLLRQKKVIEGTINVQKNGNTVQLRWQPRSPDWAKARQVNTTITLDKGGYKIESKSSG
jgi:hypothetical protein